MPVRYLAVLLLAAVSAWGCFDETESITTPDPPEPDQPITIAATYSATGPRATSGTQMVTGYRIAVEILNEKGGIDGRQVRLVTLDDESNPDLAARHYFDFITSDSIDAILSPYSSPITQVVMTVTESAGWPMVAALASSPDLWSGRNRQWTVQMLSPATSQHRGAVEIAAQYGANTVGIVYENTTYAAAVARGVRTAAAEHGLEIVFDESYPLDGADHTALVAGARDADADVLLGGTYFLDAVAFGRAVHETGYAPMFVVLRVGAEDPLFLQELGPLARCIVGNAPWLPRMPTSGFISNSSNFVQRYESEHDTPPNYAVAAGFGAVEITAEAITASIAATGQIDHTAMRDFMFSLSTETMLGQFGIFPLGHPDAGAQHALPGVQVQWQDDGAGGLAQRIIHPASAAEAEPCFLR